MSDILEQFRRRYLLLCSMQQVSQSLRYVHFVHPRGLSASERSNLTSEQGKRDPGKASKPLLPASLLASALRPQAASARLLVPGKGELPAPWSVSRIQSDAPVIRIDVAHLSSVRVYCELYA